MKRIELTNLEQDKFEEIKDKEIKVLFCEEGKVVRMKQGKVSLLLRSAPIDRTLGSSLLTAIVFEDEKKVMIDEAIKFIDSSSSKRVYIEYE